MLHSVSSLGAVCRGCRYENEVDILSTVPPHPNITRLWAQFVSEVPDPMLPNLPEFTREQATYVDETGTRHRRKAQFAVTEFHGQTLRGVSRDGGVPPFAVFCQRLGDVLRAVAFCHDHAVAHLNISPDSVLIADDGHAVLCDFGSAIKFPDSSMSLPAMAGISVSGNEGHTAPEILNAITRKSRGRMAGGIVGAAGGTAHGAVVDYSRQEVFACGVLAYEIATGRGPWADYPNECRDGMSIVSYSTSSLPALPADYPSAVSTLVAHMLSEDPRDRPDPGAALGTLARIAAEVGVRVDGPIVHVVGADEVPGEPRTGTGGYVLAVQNAEGHDAAVEAGPTDTVATVKETAARLLFPGRSFRDFKWELVLDNRPLADATYVSSLPLSPDSVLVLLSLSAASAKKLAAASSAPVGRILPPGEHTPMYDPAMKSATISLTSDRLTAYGAAWGSARLSFPGFSGMSRGIHTLSIRVDHKASAGGLCIGVCTSAFDARTKNVGAAPYSWGYSSSGKKSAGSPNFLPYAMPYGTGDVITMRLDCERHTLTFYKNMQDLNIAFSNVVGPELFPCICLGGKPPGSPERDHRLSVVPAERPSENIAADGEGEESKHSDMRLAISGEDYRFSTDRKSPNLVVGFDGRRVKGCRWGCAALKYPEMMPDTGLHTFKFRILKKASKGGICIGVADRLFDIRKKNLGASLGSWGYAGSGKRSDGKPKFEPYGRRFGAGDVVGMEVDTTVGALRFTVNGIDQGIACTAGLRSHTLVPAVCVGGAPEGEEHEVEVLEVVRYFDAERCGPAVTVTENGSTVVATGWGSAMMRHGGFSGGGKHMWSIRVNHIASTGGVCVGIARSDFNIKRSNIGAAKVSWAYSNSGKTSAGTPTFTPYGEHYTAGDIIGVCLDLDAGVLSFAKNGVELGPAADGLDTSATYVPAVCLGGARGREMHSLSIEDSTIYLPAGGGLRESAAGGAGASRPAADDAEVLKFSATHRHPSLVLKGGGSIVEATKWGSVVVDTEHVSSGTHSWTFKILRKAPVGGICVGVVTKEFDARTRNVGAARGSWGYSSSGKKGGGSVAFEPYGTPFGTGDTVVVTLNADHGSLSFSRNGEDLGEAFRDAVLATEEFLPAVCLGGSRGDNHQVAIVSPITAAARQTQAALHKFSNTDINPKAHLCEDQRGVIFVNWGSVLVDHPLISTGKARWWFKILQKGPTGGIAIGMVDGAAFDAKTKNVGASGASWGYSSSGKKSAGSPRFVDYSEAYTTGDIIGMEFDATSRELRFSKNGVDLGVAFDNVAGAHMVAAVCAGGGGRSPAEGHEICLVQPPPAFDVRRASRVFTFSDDALSVETMEWGSVYLLHSGMRRGTFRWSIKVDHKASAGGICIGVAEERKFKVQENNVGADKGSWGYSSLGRKSGGSRDFEVYGSGYGSGDVIDVELDMEAGTLAFSKNGERLGTAFAGLQGKVLVPAVCAGGSKTTPHRLSLIPATSGPFR